MWDERENRVPGGRDVADARAELNEELEREIAAARAELKEAILEQARLIRRRDLLKEKNAPRAFLARYKLDILDQTEKINGLHERIHMLANLKL